jgi:WD40 repeat-containing protein SMU1
MKSGKCIREFRGHKSFITDFLVFDQEERRLLSSSADGTMKVWDMKTAACRQTITMESSHSTDDSAILKLLMFKNEIIALRRDSLCIFGEKLQMKKKLENPLTKNGEEFLSLVKSPNEQFLHVITAKGSILSYSANWEIVEQQNIYASDSTVKPSEIVGIVQHPTADMFAVFAEDGNLRLFS